jgi:hypothetical protein
MTDHRLRAAGLGSLWQRTPPTYQPAVSLSPLDRLFLYVLRPAWAWRAELATALVLLLAWRLAADVLGRWLAAYLLMGLVAGLANIRPIRETAIRVWQRGQLRRAWAKAMRHADLTTFNDRIPVIRSIEAVPAGDRLRVRVPPGRNVTQLGEAAETIASTLGVQDIRVARDPKDAQAARVVIVRRDPLAATEPIAWPHLSADRLSLWEPIPLGPDEDGQPVYLRLAYRNVLVAGEPDAGKSVALSMVVATAALDPDVRLVLIDGKHVELAPWAGCAEIFVGPDLAEANRVLASLREDMDARYVQLLNLRKRKVTPGDGMPLIVVACDELALFVHNQATQEAKKLAGQFALQLHDLIARGRAVGLIVVAATQKPSHDVIPTYLRDLVAFRWAMRCTTPHASDTVLGAGWAAQGFNAATIDIDSPGVGYLLHEGRQPIRLKACYLTDDDLDVLARRAERLRGVTRPDEHGVHFLDQAARPGAEGEVA